VSEEFAVVGPPPAEEVVTGDRIATDLLRVGLDANHKLVAERGLGVGLRAALFSDLAFAGAIGDAGRHPTPTGEAPDDRILRAVHATVQRRSHVGWGRWYRHVDVDVEALTDELIAAGRWAELGRSALARSFHERDASQALALGRRARAVGLGRVAPASPHEAVLGVLTVAIGGGHGEARPRDTVPLKDLLEAFPDLPGQRRQGAVGAVQAAQNVLRRRFRRYR
jgi:hypothetical protein